MTPATDLTISDLWIDHNQGLQHDGRAFGYIGTAAEYADADGDDVTYCGWFFSWPSDHPTCATAAERAAILASLELDETEQHREAIPQALALAVLTTDLDRRFGQAGAVQS